MSAGRDAVRTLVTDRSTMDRDEDARLRAANRRTGALLVAIALLFFFGIIASRFIDSPLVSTGVVGGAVLLYLIVAIGRHLRK